MTSKKELEKKIDGLQKQLDRLTKKLETSRVLSGIVGPHYPQMSIPIALPRLKEEIHLIKEFLGIELVFIPRIPEKKVMKKKEKV